jgi:O-antigen/teichoic acid export membrane protein
MNAWPSFARIGAAASGFWRGDLARQSLLIALPFGLQQAIRLIASIVLARILAPEAFGFMLIINTLRTGTELLSDIGIGQSIVRSPHAKDKAFLDTAWTLQVVRGVMLMLVTLALAAPISSMYSGLKTERMIAVVSLVFVTAGLQSPGIYIVQRSMQLWRRGVYDVVCTLASSMLTIILALFWPNVWSLIWGLILGVVVVTALSYGLVPGSLPRFRWHRDHAREILHFGKWIFLSTAIYFAAISADKFYFSAALPLTLVGIYSVSRTFADLLRDLAQRLGAFLVFPKVVELRERRSEVAASIQHKRFRALALIAGATALSLAACDALILLLYDARYHAAAFMLPILLGTTWFAVLAAFSEATLFGLDRPQATAFGNGAKFIVMIVGLPLAVPRYGILAGLLVLLLAEMVRWLVLSFALQKEKLSSVRGDVMLTVGMIALAASLKLGLSAIGLVPDFHQWWALGMPVHG